MRPRLVAALRFLVWAAVFWWLGWLINCYTLAWMERLRHGRGRVVRVNHRARHYGLRLELVTLHYTPHFDSWWGWRRHIELNAQG